jgi:iron complex transport system ATP-binding protein
VLSAHDVNGIAGVATHVLALHGDGGWSAGPAAELLSAATLERVYGCAWRQVGPLWATA